MYTITIYQSGLSYSGFGQYATNDKTLKIIKSETKKEIKKELQKICKEYELEKQIGFWGNSKTGIEASVNY